MRIIKALLTLALIAGANSAFAAPQVVTLIQHNERSGAGTLFTRVWAAGCLPTTGGNCYDYANAWTAANIDPSGSTATWTWDDATGVLAGSGLFISTLFMNNNPNDDSIIADRVVDLTVDTINGVTTASNYRCIEGNFLANIGANGCGAYSLGSNPADSSSVAYNVGGDPYCIQRTMGGDDVATGNPRGVRTTAAYVSGSNNCDATNGAFNLYTVVTNSGGFLVLGNDGNLSDPNSVWMTFAVPVPAAVWLLASALGVLGWVRRKTVF